MEVFTKCHNRGVVNSVYADTEQGNMEQKETSKCPQMSYTEYIELLLLNLFGFRWVSYIISHSFSFSYPVNEIHCSFI